MDIDLIKELVNFFESSKLQKLSVKKEDFEISLEKECVKSMSPMIYETQARVAAPVVLSGEKKDESTGVFITAPMVGTFYGAAAPNLPNFVKVGDKVSKGMVVGIVEAMKVMNEIKADQSGEVAEILIHSGQPVEFGSKLFRVVSA